MHNDSGIGQLDSSSLVGTAERARRLLADVFAWLKACDLRLPLIVCSVHWLCVAGFAAIGVLHAAALPEVPTAGYRLPPLHGWQHYLVQPLRNWDGYWYGLIAEQGYEYHRAAAAFWPLYPWTVGIFANVFAAPVELVGIVLSHIAFLAALVVVRNLVRLQSGAAVADRTLWLIALFPTAFFFSALYTESFFLLFSVLTFWWAQTGRWKQAGVAAFLAALTRNVGGALLIPLALVAAARYGRDPRQWPRATAAMLLAPAGSMLYLAYLWLIWDNPLLTFTVQSNWGRSPAPPWRAFTLAWDQIRVDWLWPLISSPSWSTLTSFNLRWGLAESEALDVAAMLLIVPLLVVCCLRLPAAWSVWCAIVVAVPLLGPSIAHPLMSLPRYMLVLFPLFVVLAQATSRRWVYLPTLAVSTVLLGALTIQFATWFWVA